MAVQIKSAIALLISSCLISAASAEPTNIGLAMTTGQVEVDGASMPGSAAIFPGSSIFSEDKTSNLRFSDGTTAVMNPGTRMTVYSEHSVLQSGIATQSGIDKHPVFANGLRVTGSTPSSVASIAVGDASHVEVASREGELKVFTPSGKLVAELEPKKVFSFAITQTPAAAGQTTPAASTYNEINLCGMIGQNLSVTDAHTKKKYQLQGPDVRNYIGSWANVRGLVVGDTGAGKAVILNVVKLEKGKDNCAIVGAWGNTAFLVAVAAGGTLLGVAVAGGFSGSSPSPVTPAVP